MNQFSEKMDNSEFLGPNLPKNGFWGQIFKNLSLDLESRPKDLKTKIPCVTIFCQSLYLGKLPNYVQYFVSNIVEGVAESWVEMGARFSNTPRKETPTQLFSCGYCKATLLKSHFGMGDLL